MMNERANRPGFDDLLSMSPQAEAGGQGMHAMLERVPCDICESTGHRTLFTSRENRSWWQRKCDDDPRLDREHEFKVVRCSDCGHVFVNPRLPSEVIDDIYARYWRSHEPNGLDRNAYASYVCRQLAALRPVGDLLDFGSGWGVQLKEAEAAGWRAVGLEVDRRKIEFCREQGLSAVFGDLLERPFEPESFDAVMAEQVFEHLYSPVPYLEEIRRVLRPGGVVYIAVPNFGGIEAKLQRTRWDLLHPVSHVRYFDRASLAHLMSRCGFEVIKPRQVKRFDGAPLKEAAYAVKTFVEGNLGMYPWGLALYGRKTA
jgi:SAM-dependent methyltransferase